MICNKCSVDTPKIRAEARNKPQRGFRYRSDEGRLWSGNTCPECAYPRVKAYLAPEVGYDEREGGELIQTQPKRYCRSCEKRLPASRYFLHVCCDARYQQLEGEV